MTESSIIFPLIILLIIFMISVLLFVFIFNYYDLIYYHKLLLSGDNSLEYTKVLKLPFLKKNINSKLKKEKGDIFNKINTERLTNVFSK